MPEGALCGTREVFENRAARTGRKIPLRIVVLPATGRERLPDPLTFFAGGPGEASIPEGIFRAEQLESLRRNRDVLLIDFRGTGQSGGLFCTELGEDFQGFLDNFLPTDKIRACRDRLGKEVASPGTPPTPRWTMSRRCARPWATARSTWRASPTARAPC